jgi:hypothetical protein
MAYLKTSDLKQIYTESKIEAKIWREDYPSYERLADNGLMEGLDTNLPEVNDGSLSAALFKLPKRIVSSKLTGTAKAIDRDEAWVGELANIIWQNEIIPYANTQAPFIRKWKDAVRKAAIYGSVPLITIFVDKDGRRHADFIVAQPQDVVLEPGKVSDYDSDVQFWDIYYTKLQLENMIEQAKKENADHKEDKAEGEKDDSVNKWDITALEKILAGNYKEERDPQDTPRQENEKNTRPKGFKFCIAVQKGIEAPFYMYHKATDSTVREWSNPDPTGDSCIHFLYCYQDFINPYGTGIVKLAGGTQNVLDYMRQADVLATQLGLRPPIEVAGDADSADLESLVYSQDALWFTGNAQVQRMEMSNQIYQALPERMAMYKTSLNQLIPTGDTSIAAGAGDPQYSKTPAGVKFQAASLSIDDEDFKDNLYITYAAVAKSMINTHFANMDGKDLVKLTDDEREILMKAGMEFQENEEGELSNEVEVEWDTIRATFDFTVDPEQDKAQDDADKLEGLMKVAELTAADPTIDQSLAMSGKKLNKGELFSEIIGLTSDNDKIIVDISPEEMAQNQMGVDPMTGLPMQGMGQELPQEQMQDAGPEMPQENMEQQPQGQPSPEEMQANTQAVMQQYGVDEQTALTALAAEHQGYPMEDIIVELQKSQQGMVAQ